MVLFCIPILLLIVFRIIGFDGLYGQDSYEYLRYTKAIEEYLISGEHPGVFFWPVLYPTLGSFFGFFFGTTLALQLISCISFSVACVYILKTLQLIYPKSFYRFIYVLVFAVFCPFLLKMGLIVMSDSLALAFIVLSFYFFFKSHYKDGSIIPIFVFVTCAFMTRYPSIIITFPIIAYTLYLVIKRRKIKDFSIAILLSFLAFIPFLVFQFENVFKVTSNSFLKLWSVANYFKSSFTTHDGTTSYKFINLVYIGYLFFHPGFIFIGSILSFLLLKHYNLLNTFPQKTLVICSSLYILFLAGIPFQNPRILGLVFPLILLLFFPVFLKLMNFKVLQKYPTLFTTLSISLQIVFFMLTFTSVLKRSIIEKELITMVQPYQKNTLYSFDVDLAMQGHGLDFNYKNLYLKRYTKLNKNDLILFNPKRYEEQWKNKNPMLNWRFINKNYSLKLLETHPKGWKLYRIK